jgi:hypothetical protein
MNEASLAQSLKKRALLSSCHVENSGSAAAFSGKPFPGLFTATSDIVLDLFLWRVMYGP